MPGIYKRSLACVRANWPLYIALAVLLEVVPLLFAGARSSGAELVAGFIFAYYLHRHFLLGQTLTSGRPAPGSRPEALGRFLLVSVILLGGTMAIVIFLANAISGWAGWDGAPNARTMLIGLVALLMLFLYPISLSLFGTALPAAAVRERFGLAVTLRRGVRAFLPTLFGLVAGPGLFAGATMAILLWLPGRLGWSLDFLDPQAGFSAFGLVVGVATRLLGLFTTTLAVAVLCGVYRRVEPQALAA